MLMEKLGTLSGLWNQSLRLANVTHDDVADVGAELLPCQLQIVVRLQDLTPLLR